MNENAMHESEKSLNRAGELGSGSAAEVAALSGIGWALLALAEKLGELTPIAFALQEIADGK